ncbi:hypothetical protein ATO6_01665 [Oceanicola sp. 22II-s10i]|uniref:DUF1801 domain-containing protein n=1 Tax=Oceanicola sp. 22II-s10i TaxID=1317116 RepID=UPI000B527A42|nr:DUF1801 domain-containing protein [Oceanicola sp. 22II-s10i]OWU85663.1 hypothetical protein ATO6_01665 [Oceanicola sp. 22II-s10i]
MLDESFDRTDVAAYFQNAPEPARTGLMTLRRLILSVASETPGVGRLDEALRWNQLAYLTPDTKSGSTLRLGVTPGGFALYAHCRTSIIPDFAAAFPGLDRIEGTRGVHFQTAADIDPPRHAQLIRHALTYHLRR